jgi:hypothetical protein
LPLARFGPLSRVCLLSTPLTITKDVDGLVCHIITSSLHLMCCQFKKTDLGNALSKSSCRASAEPAPGVPDLTANCRGEGGQERNYITEELTWCPRTFPLAIELALIRGLDCRMPSCLLPSRALKMLGPMLGYTKAGCSLRESLHTRHKKSWRIDLK